MNMTPFHVVQLLALGVFAGGLGALTGIGGGIIITPFLTLVYGVPIHQAIGTSLCCVIATSSGAAASYVEQHLSDIRLGMTLELASSLGAISGAFLAGVMSREALAIFFALLLTYAGGAMLRRPYVGGSMLRRPVIGGAEELEDVNSYQVKHWPLGLLGSAGAGIISGLLGVGGGPIKVPLMYLVMGVPFKVASATSNFIMGVTAAASAFIYYSRGDVRPLITAPTAIGVFFGAGLGSRLMRRTPSRRLIILLTLIMFYLAVTMAWKSLRGGFSD